MIFRPPASQPKHLRIYVDEEAVARELRRVSEQAAGVCKRRKQPRPLLELPKKEPTKK